MINFRLDRFLTLYFFRHVTKRQTSTGDKRIPILMYHSISDEKETSHPYYHVNTSPAVFYAHMLYLHENNYSVITLQDLEKSFDTRDSSKYVVITFDDGFRDFFTNAFPILRKYNFTATVFLPSAFISNHHKKLKEKEHLSWHEVRELSAAGISFGSHTENHPQLSELSDTEVEHEIQHSKENIEESLGSAIDTFSYPYKFPDENKRFKIILRDLLNKYGYKYGVSTRIGTTSKKDDAYFMKRLPINSADDMSFFQAKLDGGYNWLYYLQTLSKFIRSKVM